MGDESPVSAIVSDDEPMGASATAPKTINATSTTVAGSHPVGRDDSFASSPSTRRMRVSRLPPLAAVANDVGAAPSSAMWLNARA